MVREEQDGEKQPSGNILYRKTTTRMIFRLKGSFGTSGDSADVMDCQ